MALNSAPPQLTRDPAKQMFAVITLVTALALACNRAVPSAQRSAGTPDVREQFIQEAESRGIRVVRVLSDGRIVLDYRGTETTVSLENLSRNVARDGSATAVRQFIDAIVATEAPFPPWSVAQSHLLLSAEGSDLQFGDVIRRTATDTVERVLVYVPEDESRISWVGPAQLRKWGVEADVAWQVAERNTTALLRRMPIQIEPIENMKLGMFDSESVMKASVVFSPDFKQVVRAKVGWPVYVVIPCRDFVYFFASKDLIPRVGRTVVEEYKSSGYPITPDVLLISDRGVEAVGTFPLE